MMRTLMIVALSLMFVVALQPAALADGCFMWREGADLMEPEQAAIIHTDGETETLVLRVKYLGEAAEFAWVVPLPNVPEVTAIDEEDVYDYHRIFAELSRYTQMRERRKAYPPSVGGILRSMTAGSESVDVVERGKVGVYDVAVLAADDPGALQQWLIANGFAFPERGRSVLERYIDDGWVFVAMRIAPDELTLQTAIELRTGHLQPIMFRFAGEETVYPLHLSSLNAGDIELLVYTLADYPLVPAAGPRVGDIGFEHSRCTFKQLGSGVVDRETGMYEPAGPGKLERVREQLGLNEDPLHVGKYRIVYEAGELTDDLTFEPLDPVAHWGGIRREALSERERAFAGFVLSHHDATLLAELASGGEQDRCAAAYSAAADSVLLARLAHDPSADVRWMVAANPKAPPAVLAGLAADENAVIYEALATNRATPPEALRQIAGKEKEWYLHMLARNPNLPADVWQMWADSPDERVRERTAAMREAPADIVEQLTHDPSAVVRKRIVSSQRITEEAMLRLAGDESEKVRMAVARSCGPTEENVLWLLSRDSEWGVREMVARARTASPELLMSLVRDPHFRVREEVASNKQTPEDALRHLMQDEDERVRLSVAMIHERPPDILTFLAADASEDVRSAVGWNSHAPAEVLEDLADDPSEEVRERVAANRSSDASILTALSMDGGERVRWRVASNTSAPLEVLGELASDAVWRVRQGVARNRSASDEILLRLAADPVDSVCERARRLLYDRGYEDRALDGLLEREW